MTVRIIKANTVQIMDYYPFGLMWEKQDVASTDNLKWHHGKEFQENEFAQQGKSLDLEDFGARMYDPILGRWWSVDPLAEKFLSLSPYNGMGNNPIFFIDPNGREVITHDGGNRTVYTGEDAAMALMALQAGEEQKAQQQDTDPVKPQIGLNASAPSIGLGFSPQKPKPFLCSSCEPGSRKNLTLSDYGKVVNGNGALLGIAENFTGKSTLGTNFKIYQSGWRGNQYVSTAKIAGVAKIFGVGSLIFGSVLDAKGVYNYYSKGPNDENAVHPTEAGTNFGIGTWSLFTGPPGWVAGTGYYLGGLMPGGWNGNLLKLGTLQQNNQQILGRKFNLFRDY
jgi:RHS repeat-associated protein